MCKPWLFNDDSLYQINPAIFSHTARMRFGETAKLVLTDSGVELSRPATTETEQISAEWNKALAAEALLLPPCQRKNPPFSAMEDAVQPCGRDAPSYGILKELRVASALFPLASLHRGGSPALGRIWAVEGWDGARGVSQLSLDSSEALMELAARHNITLFVDCPSSDITGTSWQLAAALAIKALGQSVSDETRLSLAADWIITGTVENDSIQSVAMGNKLEAVNGVGNRKWLYPSSDRTAFEQANALVHSKTGRFVPSVVAGTVSAAFRIIAGHGTRPEQGVTWPKEIGVMHALVGGSIYANLAAVFFCPPRKLYLWHSSDMEKSVKPAKRTATILQTLIPSLHGNIHLHAVPTDDLAAAEDVLEPFLNQPQETGELYFNITSSNRMMMMAVFRWAQSSPHIKLIYRDIDANDLEYIQIWHEAAVSHTRTLTPELPEERRAILLGLLSKREIAEEALKRIEGGKGLKF